MIYACVFGFGVICGFGTCMAIQFLANAHGDDLFDDYGDN